MHGLEWYFFIAISISSSTPSFGVMYVGSMFNSSESAILVFAKNSSNIFAIWESSIIICPFSIAMVPLSVCTFLEKRAFIVSKQNFQYQTDRSDHYFCSILVMPYILI